MTDFGLRLNVGIASVLGQIAVIALISPFGGGSADAHDVSPVHFELGEVLGPMISTFQTHCALPMLETGNADVSGLEFRGSFNEEPLPSGVTELSYSTYQHQFGPVVELLYVNNEFDACMVVWKRVRVEAFQVSPKRLRELLNANDTSFEILEYGPDRIKSVPEAWIGGYSFTVAGNRNFPITVDISLIGERKHGSMKISSYRWPPLGTSLPLN